MSQRAGSVLILACGALARELLDLVAVNKLDHVSVECLPAKYHNEPDKIIPELAARLPEARERYDDILIGYADCGTGGRLDAFCEEHGLDRLPGDHCYGFFAGNDAFLTMHEAELGTLYLTDYLATHFERLIWQGLGIADHPELRDMYFGNYTRVLYLAQRPTEATTAAAKAAAERLGLRYESITTDYGELSESVVTFAGASPRSRIPVSGAPQ